MDPIAGCPIWMTRLKFAYLEDVMKIDWSWRNIAVFVVVLMLALVAIYVILRELQKPEITIPLDHPYAGPIPSGALARLGKGGIAQIVISPDGETIAVGSTIGMYVYTFPSMEFIWYGKTEKPIHCVDFSKDGNLIAAAEIGSITLWDSKSGEQVRTFPGHARNIASLRFAPDGSALATASIDFTIVEWDLQSGEKLNIFEDFSTVPTSLSYSPNGEKLVAGIYDGSIIVWDRATGEQIASMSGGRTSGYGVADIEFSQDGSRFVSGSKDGLVILRETAEWQVVDTFDTFDYLADVAFSPDGNVLVVAGWSNESNAAMVWDLDAKESLVDFEGEEGDINQIAFSPDGETLVTWSYTGKITLYDTQTWGVIKRQSGFKSPINSLAYSPNGTTIAIGSWGGEILLWGTRNINQMSMFAHQDKTVSSLIFSPDGEILASGSFAEAPYGPQSVLLWDVKGGELLYDLEGHTDSINDLAFSPDGTKIASASDDGSVMIWSTQDGIRLEEIWAGEVNPNMKTDVKSIRFHPKGERIAACYGDGTVILWEIASGESIFKLPGDNWECAVTFSPDGEILAASSEVGLVNLFNARSGEKSQFLDLSLDESGQENAKCLVYSPDGSLLAVGMSDGKVFLFDAYSGERLRILRGHSMYITALAFSQNGHMLISGSYDGTVLFWEMDS